MATPKQSGKEKAVILSVSCSRNDKNYMIQRNISPSKLLQGALNELRGRQLQEQSISKKLETDIDIVRNSFIKSLKPHADKTSYYNIINKFVEKYPDWTKAEIMGRAERPRYFDFKKYEDYESIENGL